MSDKKTEVVEDTEDKKSASKLPKKKKEIGHGVCVHDTSICI